MNAAQSAKTISRHACASEVRHLDAFRRANHHVFNLSFAVDEDADLSARFKRYFRQLAGEFRRDDLFGSDAPRGEPLDAF